ncbi:class II fructose-bisphosphate aldolase [Paratissierella segnis]|jgi:fructose-bisphosphate aldolase class II|uniref:Class II fructose-bisphosphate aldolase n=1 Tax=Paratissierella segnis TaxID=2763679 RepID=A0A926ET34_9FIRM|nr:class II fructose-bisphosphate aldolase [Paratissierella segnis]MBC8589278.1 class II fructose-bisphosphate aldolase [Paratissierella segnis]
MTGINMGQMLLKAKEGQYAIGAFNIFNYISAKAAIKAAEDLNSFLILQTSVGTVKQIGASQLIEMLNILRSDTKVPVIVHLDHCKDVSLAKECIDKGWDSVMIDASEKSLIENIDTTLEVKCYAEKKNVTVEGELGVIRGVEEEIIVDEEKTTKYSEVVEYLNATGIDAIAPAVGTAHGLYKGAVSINYDLVKKISKNIDCPVVIHGGTGLEDDVFKRLIRNGATKINISTALKHAYIDACREYIQTNNEEYNPLKLDAYVESKIYEVVKKHIITFNSVDSVTR